MQADDRNEIDKAGTQILHPGSRALFRYWEGLRAERACPERHEIQLTLLSSLLPNLVILEDQLTGTWNFRLAGTAVCDLLQQSLTGKDALGGFDTFERDVVSKTFDVAKNRLQPCLVRMRLISTAHVINAAEMVGLPVKDSSTGKVQLFGGLFTFSEHEASQRTMLLRRELVSSRLIWTEHENGDLLLGQVGRRATPLRVIQGGLA